MSATMGKILVIQFEDRKIKLKVDYPVSEPVLNEIVRIKFPTLDHFRLEYQNLKTGRFSVEFPTVIRAVLHILVIQDNPVDSRDFPMICSKSFIVGGDGLLIRGQYITINEPINSTLGTGLTLWDGSVVLAKFLEKNRHLVEGKRVLELGAGTGIADNLRGNVQRNFFDWDQTTTTTSTATTTTATTTTATKTTTSDATHASITVRALDWSDASTYPSVGTFDVILAADVVWLEQLVAPLVQTIKSIMGDNNSDDNNNTNCIFLISMQTRSQQTEDLFFSMITSQESKTGSRAAIINMTKVGEEDYHEDFRSPKISIYRGEKRII
eukprot:gene11587-24249_t